ncbi:14496_t:CDS:1 [Funneliformis geosporum]|uniref:19511_t:CDS:1 n=1 Tax=Funneliformis geosporum TaxID=1117311 RepID=A0A9W4SWT9_9GLOM|nr:14496_t:CDS:1 [Funneliformis geosporum]CAI2183566.1 19511_t:CDS:1 [Funneliformis geosporum]
MTPQLNYDCLGQIFKFIIDDDENPALLHPFALVNQMWCQAVMPFLWSNPWKFCKDGVRLLPMKRNLLIKTYLSCLYQESRGILINEHFFQELFSISNENLTSQGMINNDSNIDYILKRPAFDYANFLRHLKLNSLAYAVNFWMKFNLINLSKSHCVTIRYNMLVEMINYLVVKSPCLFKLDIRYCDGELRQSLKILTNLLERSEGRVKSLLELKTFEYNGKVKELQQIFKVLSITSHKILRIPVYVNTLSENLLNLLKVQKNLSEVTITSDSVETWKCEWGDIETIYTTITKANLITHLTLENIFIPLSFVSLCENLKELNLINVYLQTKKYWEPLSTTFLPNLQKFHCEPKLPDITLYPDVISKFIQNSCELSQIILRGKVEESFSVKDLLMTMANSCPNLTVYEGPIGSKETNELKGLLTSCKNISTLHLHSISMNVNCENFDNLLNEISQIIPKKLRVLMISGKWIITSSSLEKFLKSRENLSSRGKISFYWGSLEGKFRKICRKYQEKGIVEKYGDCLSC